MSKEQERNLVRNHIIFSCSFEYSSCVKNVGLVAGSKELCPPLAKDLEWTPKCLGAEKVSKQAKIAVQQ